MQNSHSLKMNKTPKNKTKNIEVLQKNLFPLYMITNSEIHFFVSFLFHRFPSFFFSFVLQKEKKGIRGKKKWQVKLWNIKKGNLFYCRQRTLVKIDNIYKKTKSNVIQLS